MRELANREIVTLMVETHEQITVTARLHIPADQSVRERLPLLPVCVATLTIGLVFVAGCGPRNDRLAVSGNVTLDGAPLDTGSIRFTSQGTEKLSASGATIGNGEFQVPQEKGLPPGTYHVEISAPDTNGPLVSYRGAPGQPAMPPTAPERIPPEYNSNSKHSIEVTPDGDNHFVFDIVSRRAK
jgi:hypothetical protein